MYRMYNHYIAVYLQRYLQQIIANVFARFHMCIYLYTK